MNKQEAIEKVKEHGEFYTTEDFTTPTECLTEALGSIQGLHDEKRIEDRENAERLIDSYKYAEEMLRSYYKGSILKYLLHEREKNGLEDLKKARKHLDWLIELEEQVW